MKLIKSIAVATGMLVAASAANAGTINVSYQGPGPFGVPNLSKPVSVDYQQGHVIGTIQSGPFRLTGSKGFGDFMAFCVELTQSMKNKQSYYLWDNSYYGATVDAAVEKLFNFAFGDVTNATKGAAFQVALWEIISDNNYDLSAGQFKVTGTSASVLSTAQYYLDNLASATTGAYKMIYMDSETSQDLVTVAPVPVPAAGGMLLLGLGGLAAARRRKAAA